MFEDFVVVIGCYLLESFCREIVFGIDVDYFLAGAGHADGCKHAEDGLAGAGGTVKGCDDVRLVAALEHAI